MHLPKCPVCKHVWTYVAMQWSGGLPCWTVPAREHALYMETCTRSEAGIGAGSTWCPVMRQTLHPELPPQPRSMRGILGQFQSLGDNCEFGLLQRWEGRETEDLLRLAAIWIPVEGRARAIITALSNEFSGLGDPDSVRLEPVGAQYPREYIVRETHWNLFLHTGVA